MTMLRLFFAGHIKTVRPRVAAGKSVIEFSLCNKNYEKDQTADATFTWVNCVIFEPKSFHVEMLQKDRFVSGFGKLEMRSYQADDGTKKSSISVIVSGFDLDGPKSGESLERASRPVPPSSHAPAPPNGGGFGDEEPPFTRFIGADAWG